MVGRSAANLITNNPWDLARKCITNKCLDRVLNDLKLLLLKPLDTLEYERALEFIKALRSLNDDYTDEVLSVLINDEKLLNKVLSDFSIKNMFRLYRSNYSKAMGLLVLQEVIIPKLNEDIVTSLMKSYLRDAFKVLDGRELTEFIKSLIYGPLTRLNTKELLEITLTVREIPNDSIGISLKSDYLVMVVTTYPPRVFSNISLVEALARILSDICDAAVTNLSVKKDLMEVVYGVINTVTLSMNFICKELGDWRPCKHFDKISKDHRERVYKELSKLLLSYIESLQTGNL